MPFTGGVNDIDAGRIQHAFGLEALEESSLSPWSPVHRGRTIAGEAVVAKRTAKTPVGARAVARWLHELRAEGVDVVAPVATAGQNPRAIGDEDDQWVVYPFVEGEAYVGSPDQIAAAGDLLGRMHAAHIGDETRGALREYGWPETERSDVDGDLETLAGILARNGGADASHAESRVRALGDRWFETALPALRATDASTPLPRAAVSSDFKAANLVYVDGTPVMVDPDNGGLEPRLFNLALALVLFHNECATAPARVLDPGEWRAFASAYARHVSVTAEERALWPHALDHMLWEEGTWALEDNDDDAWGDPRQGGQLLSLALLDPDRYPLP